MTSTSFSNALVHGEGDPMPISVGVGTTHGACHTTRLVDMSCTFASLLDAPDSGNMNSKLRPINLDVWSMG